MTWKIKLKQLNKFNNKKKLLKLEQEDQQQWEELLLNIENVHTIPYPLEKELDNQLNHEKNLNLNDNTLNENNIQKSHLLVPQNKPFIKENDKNTSILQWKSTNVPIAAACKFQLPIRLEADKSDIYYEFQTKYYDIQFEIKIIYLNNNDNEEYILLPKRFDAYKEIITGRFMDIKGPSMLYFIWDNEYSWLNIKELAYSINVTQYFNTDEKDKKIKESIDLDEKLKKQQEETRRKEEKEMQIKKEFQEKKDKFYEDIIIKRIYEAFHDRISAIEEGNRTLSNLENAAQSLEITIRDIKLQIENLKDELIKKEKHYDTVITEKNNFFKQMDVWEWEIQALSNRLIPKKGLSTIFLYADEIDIKNWAMINKNWYNAYTCSISKR